MRDSVRNRRTIYYAQYLGEMPILDSVGYETGEYEPDYTEPEQCSVNISPATDQTVLQTFGNIPDYSMVIATSRNFPFTEKTVFWVTRPLEEPHEYKVVKVAKSINGLLVALELVHNV